MSIVVIPKNRLMLLASVVWCIAGAMVCKIGLPLLWQLGMIHLVLYPLALIVFLIFYFFVFTRLVSKHTTRIREIPEPQLPFWQFFDASSYIVMAIMMIGGMWLRLSHVVPNWTIAFFYSGLGIALFSCGTRFLAVFLRKDVLKVSEKSKSSQQID